MTSVQWRIRRNVWTVTPLVWSNVWFCVVSWAKGAVDCFYMHDSRPTVTNDWLMLTFVSGCGERSREKKERDEGLWKVADWNQQCCKRTGTLHSISMPDSTMRRQLDSLYTCTCRTNGQQMHAVKQRTAQTRPSPPRISRPFPLHLVLSWSLSRSHKQRKRERGRNKALVLHALTQHLCLSWFQMNKAEYQVAHLYATQRQIDQSITAGCCWITNALWCLYVCLCIWQLFFFICCALNASVCMNIVLQYVNQSPVSFERDVFFSVIAPDVSTVNENRKAETVWGKGIHLKQNAVGGYFCLNLAAKVKSVECAEGSISKDQFHLYLLFPPSWAPCISLRPPVSPECSTIGLSEQTGRQKGSLEGCKQYHSTK